MIVSEETNDFYDFDMFDNYELISYLNSPKVPNWVASTIHVAGELVGNPNDTRRTRSQFESALCVKDTLFVEKCYLMIDSNPQT